MSTESSAPRMSLHLPVGLLSLAIAIFLASQIGAANRGRATMNWQIENLDKQKSQLQDAQKQFADALVKRDELVKKADAIQQQYTALLNDVLALSATDPDAAKVVEKYKIQRNAPADAPAADATKADEKKSDGK